MNNICSFNIKVDSKFGIWQFNIWYFSKQKISTLVERTKARIG